MNGLRQSLDDYLTVRRSLGYKLEDAARVLRSFVAFADQAGAGSITSELAVRWATQPVNRSSIWLVHRLSIVRGFASYLQTIDAATEIPPAELLSAAGYRPAPPYLYSEADIAALMAAARQLPSPLRAVMFETLIGLLAVTGIRIGEAMRLDRDDVDCTAGLLRVRGSKFGRSREVLCHDSTIEALRAYSGQRDQLCPHPRSPSFFVTSRGSRLMLIRLPPLSSRVVCGGSGPGALARTRGPFHGARSASRSTDGPRRSQPDKHEPAYPQHGLSHLPRPRGSGWVAAGVDLTPTTNS